MNSPDVALRHEMTAAVSNIMPDNGSYMINRPLENDDTQVDIKHIITVVPCSFAAARSRR
ncbi:MAG: hypothetical protein PVH65_12285 [Chloroflexota bacterium]|jgi:hypothetical protein